MDEIDKKKYVELLHKHEGEDLDKLINLQIQKVIKETAKLIGMLEESRQILEVDTKEYKSMREFGNPFLHSLVLIAKELNIQVQ